MKRVYTVFILVSMLLVGCTDFEELNQDPTKSTEANPNIQLPTIQLLFANYSQTIHRYLIMPGGYMGIFTGDWATMTYGGAGQKNSQYMEQMWTELYPKAIKNIQDMVARTEEKEEFKNINAVSKIMKVYLFSKLTDMYGDIPYSSAGLGFYTGNLSPSYDTQEYIYNDFFKLLKEANENIGTGADAVTADLFFNGNLEKWKRFGNSLWLRLALRLTKVNPTLAEDQVNQAINAGVMTSNGDIAMVKYEDTSTDNTTGNGLSLRLLANSKNSDFRMSKTLISFLEDSGDPRLRMFAGSYLDDANRTDITEELKKQYIEYKKFALPQQNFLWQGQGIGVLTLNIAGEDVEVSTALQWMQPSKYLTNYGTPYIHMSYAEVLFLQAEAKQRFNIGSSSASEYYQEGIEAAINQMSLFGADVDLPASKTFAESKNLTAGNQLNDIHEQLWVLLLLDPIEQWNNYRRTELPQLLEYTPQDVSGAVNQSGGQMPRRMQYPLEEELTNKENYDEAVSRPPLNDSDNWTDRVWWDKQ